MDGNTWTERWACDPPPLSAYYEVLEDEWSDDDTVRTIRRVNIMRKPARESEEA